MKPSEYIKAYKQHENFNSLQIILDIYRRDAREWEKVFREWKLKKLPRDETVAAMQAEIPREIALAEKTIDRWRKKFQKRVSHVPKKGGRKA